MARKPFVVIDAEILSSSVWSESAHVRLVWLTLLILCDTDGYVGASVPGIARAAGVTLEQAEDALDVLAKPDPYSRTKAHDGRRIALAERGWTILNFREHLDRLSSERAKSRERMRRHREKQRALRHGDATVTAGKREQGIGNRERTEGRIATPPAPLAVVTVPSSWAREACDDWIARFGGTAPGGRIGSALKPLVAKHGWPAVREAWRSYLAQSEAEYASPQRFAATFGRWSGTAAAGKKPTVVDQNRAVIARFVSEGDE